MTDAPLTLPERQLAAVLAVHVADKNARCLDLHEGVYHDMGQSNFEEGCAALNLCGVYERQQHHALHRELVPVDCVAGHMAALDHVSRVAFDALLSAFIENAITYDAVLSDTRGTFRAGATVSSAMSLLARCGYAERDGDGYRWTDRIAPVMRRWHLWDETDACIADGERTAAEAKARALLDTMPPALRRRMQDTLARNGQLRLIQALRAHRHEDRWLDLPKPGADRTPGHAQDIDMDIGLRIARLLPGRG
ncbi:hypothetical protein HKCCE2091_21775 [Rhodobacterales bacterium HKCCE2091]|nr:hypothetical protein [Rhodobacterales bacterium HKCCE2091]